MAKALYCKKKISVIIPAFNEENSIADVIKTASQHWAVGEIIVVDDGSTDTTAKQAVRAGAKLYSMAKNQGKGKAMEMGVKLASHSIICFLDADICGLTKKMMDKIILPVLSGKYDMYIAIRDRHVHWLNKILHFFPLLGGERALTKELWRQVPLSCKKDFQIEIAMNYYAKKLGYRMGFCLIPNLTHSIKEKKRGWLLGFFARLRMGWDILKISWQLYIKENLFKGKFEIFVPRVKILNNEINGAGSETWAIMRNSKTRKGV